MNLPGAVKGVFVAESDLQPLLLRTPDGRIYQLKLRRVSDNGELAVLELVDLQTRVVRLYELKLAGIGGREEDQT